MTRKSLKVLMAALFVIGLSSFLCAQGSLTGALNGKVLDNEGNALPGVTVTVEGPALLGKVAYVTTEAGTFRFPALAPGSGYQLTLELPGFNTIVRKGLIVSVGKSTSVTVKMAMATLEEEITVVGESPTVDVKSSKTAVNFSKSFIYNIPMARDLYDVLNSIPGSLSEGVTYRRTSYIAGGTVRGNQYSLDGVTINDPVVMYPMTNINIDVYEEVEFGLGGHSAEVGIADGGFVNIVTRSGGNEFHGAATAEYYNEDMQKSLLSEEDLIAVGLTKPAGWNTWQDFSLSVGGPIIKDRVWFFTNGRFFKWERDFNHIIWDDTIAAGERVYTLDSAPHDEYDVFGKITLQLAPNIRLMTTYNLAIIDEFFYTNRIGSNLDITSTTRWDHETGHTISSQLNWVFSQNLFIDARLGYIASDFPLPYSEHAISNAPQLYDRYFRIYRNNPRFEETYLRHRFNPSVVATIFQDDLFGASHEIKIGAEYEYTDGNWDWWRENPWLIYTYQGGPSYPTATEPYRYRLYNRICGPSEGTTVEEESMRHYGFFIQDSVTIKERLTLNLGVRYDTSTGRFDDQHHTATADPYGVLPLLIAADPTTVYDDWDIAAEKVLTWSHISPRIGFSYDVFGDGKTSIRGSWSRYNEYLMIQYFSLANPMYPNSGGWYWYDDDNDFVVETTDRFSMRYLPTDPRVYQLEDEIDTDASAPYTDEFTFGIEREMARDFSMGLVFTYKRKTNIFEDVNDFGLGKDLAWQGYRPNSPYWEKFEFNDPGDDGEFGTGDDKTSYLYARLAAAPDIHYFLTNVDGAYRKYWALQLLFNKRMSNRWQLLGSITWSKAWGNIGGSYGLSYGASGTFDTPNSFVYEHGRLNYDRPINVKLQSTVILPLDIVLSGYLNHRSGSPWRRDVTVYIPDDPKYWDPGEAIGVPTELNGTRRNAPVTTLDLRIEKRFPIGDFGTIGGYVDIINALGRSGYSISGDPGGYVDYSDPANPTFTNWGTYGDVTGAYGNRVFKVSLRFTF
ncbi:MAG: TonB-dependent receptor [Candidatus Aminicenantes bacterium]|nr:TonB-dependent receptor [Candidatus Aminicenantes bacterium]